MSRSSYRTSTMSISLLLLLLGVAAFGVIGGQRAVRKITDGVIITAFIDPDITVGERTALEAQIRRMPNVDRTVYVSSNEAIDDFTSRNDLDTTMISDAIPSSFEITPRAIGDSPKICNAVKSMNKVTQVYYPKEAVDQLAANIKLVSGLALLAGSLLVLVVLLLVYTTIRLSLSQAVRLYGKGCLKRAAIQGFLSALIAMVLLIGFGSLVSWVFDLDLIGQESLPLIMLIGSALCVIGVTICTLMTAVENARHRFF